MNEVEHHVNDLKELWSAEEAAATIASVNNNEP